MPTTVCRHSLRNVIKQTNILILKKFNLVKSRIPVNKMNVPMGQFVRQTRIICEENNLINFKYFIFSSYSCQCPPYLSGQFCERRLAPCEYNPCLHGICHKGEKEEDYTCECLPEWTGQLCDRTVEDSEEEDDGKKCPLATNPCQNGGQCIGGKNEKKSRKRVIIDFTNILPN
jgi:hypothetical protein